MTIKNRLWSVIIASIMLISTLAVKANPVAAVLSECMACHTISASSEKAMTLDERMKRIGPSLYYAGNKFKQAWLEKWLQHPARLYPAGVYYGEHVVVTDDGDIVSETGLITHPVLNQQQAQAVTAELLQLQAKSELVAEIIPGEIKPVSRRMGSMNFRKFKGCASCHQDSAGEGGVSGPELYSAFERLQLTYLISYMKDPEAWEPKSLMPNLHLKQKDIERLVGYLKTLSEDKP
jgi:cytochrome c2